jgi:hypothetical protein
MKPTLRPKLQELLLQADARATKVANERKLAGLEESCHAKIKAVRQAHSEQLASVKVDRMSQETIT